MITIQNVRYFLGVDPGKQGAFTILNKDYEIVEKIVMPTIGEKENYDKISIVSIFKKYPYTLIAVENPGIIFGIGKTSMASLAHCTGMLEGMVAMLGLPYIMVRPVEWQRVAWQNVIRQTRKSSDGKNLSDPKATSLLAAMNKFPSEDFRASSRCKNYHDGLIDSALISYYAVSQFRQDN